mmetsp:Transcript_11777/g.11838  ORF Transcript_11777/g.11838 Transcript_11777/m.11838 type:complete len:115 (+) Transcript_11777:968-1312(+)
MCRPCPLAELFEIILKKTSSSKHLEIEVLIPVFGWLHRHSVAPFLEFAHANAGNLFLLLKFADALISLLLSSFGTTSACGYVSQYSQFELSKNAHLESDFDGFIPILAKSFTKL